MNRHVQQRDPVLERLQRESNQNEQCPEHPEPFTGDACPARLSPSHAIIPVPIPGPARFGRDSGSVGMHGDVCVNVLQS